MVSQRTAGAAVFNGCSEAGVVGWYHNHPQHPFDACRASPADSAVTESKPHYHVALISCWTPYGPAFIYRFRGDTDEYRVEPTEYLDAERLFYYLSQLTP